MGSYCTKDAHDKPEANRKELGDDKQGEASVSREDLGDGLDASLRRGPSAPTNDLSQDKDEGAKLQDAIEVLKRVDQWTLRDVGEADRERFIAQLQKGIDKLQEAIRVLDPADDESPGSARSSRASFTVTEEPDASADGQGSLELSVTAKPWAERPEILLRGVGGTSAQAASPPAGSQGESDVPAGVIEVPETAEQGPSPPVRTSTSTRTKLVPPPSPSDRKDDASPQTEVETPHRELGEVPDASTDEPLSLEPGKRLGIANFPSGATVVRRDGEDVDNISRQGTLLGDPERKRPKLTFLNPAERPGTDGDALQQPISPPRNPSLYTVEDLLEGLSSDEKPLTPEPSNDAALSGEAITTGAGPEENRRRLLDAPTVGIGSAVFLLAGYFVYTFHRRWTAKKPQEEDSMV